MFAADVFSVVLESDGPVVLLTARGEIDASTVTPFGEALDGAIREHERHVVLDAGDVTFIDSTGISTIVAAMRRLNRTRRRLAIACPADGALGRALQMTGLHHTFDVHPDADAAVADLAQAPLLGR